MNMKLTQIYTLTYTSTDRRMLPQTQKEMTSSIKHRLDCPVLTSTRYTRTITYYGPNERIKHLRVIAEYLTSLGMLWQNFNFNW